MYYGRVAGTVVSSVKDPGLAAQRLLVVQPLTPEGLEKGRPMVCTDAVGVGVGELVYWTKGKEAGFPFLPTEVPTEATIVAIVATLQVYREPPFSTDSPKPHA